MSMWNDAMCIEDKYDQYKEDGPEKPCYRYPKEIIEETDDLDFAIYILQDRCKKLSKNGAMYSKIHKCIDRLKFLKDADDKILWLERDMSMLNAQSDEAEKRIKELEAENKILRRDNEPYRPEDDPYTQG